MSKSTRAPLSASPVWKLITNPLSSGDTFSNALRCVKMRQFRHHTIMNRHRSFPSAPHWILGLFLLVLPSLCFAELRNFTSMTGKTMRMELVGHKGENHLILKNADGRQMDGVKMSVFSESDQAYIRKWMAKVPPTIKYSFKFTEEQKKLSGTSDNVGGCKNVRKNSMAYVVKMTNMSRDTVPGPLTLNYYVFMDNEGDNGYSSSSSKGEQSKKGTLKLEQPLRFNQAAEFTTAAMQIDSVNYESDSGSFRDRLVGVMVRVTDAKGKEVALYKSQALAKRDWPTSSKGTKDKVIIR